MSPRHVGYHSHRWPWHGWLNSPSMLTGQAIRQAVLRTQGPGLCLGRPLLSSSQVLRVSCLFNLTFFGGGGKLSMVAHGRVIPAQGTVRKKIEISMLVWAALSKTKQNKNPKQTNQTPSELQGKRSKQSGQR